MKEPQNQTRWWLIGSIILICMAVIASFGFVSLRYRSQETEQLRLECAALRAMVVELQAAIQQIRSDGGDSANIRGLPAMPTDPSNPALVRAIAELSLSQSNTAIVIERLLRATAGIQATESIEQAQKRLQALEASAVEEQQRCDAMKQKVNALLLSLKVPDDVASIPAAKALESPSLQAYWPYFEAKKELEPMQRILESLKIRLVQDRINVATEAAGSR